MAARQSHKLKAAGSNPAFATIFSFMLVLSSLTMPGLNGPAWSFLLRVNSTGQRGLKQSPKNARY